jgi:hypothetical protein
VFTTLAIAQRALERLNVRFALVGGVAVSIRGTTRFTRDVDLAIAVSDDHQAEQILRTLLSDRYRLVATVEQEHTKRLATARLHAHGEVIVDLLFATTGIETETVADATLVQLPSGPPLPVATVEHLLAMKVLSVSDARLQDRMDIQGLLAVSPDLTKVRALLARITTMGTHRQQNLQRKLNALLTP